MNQDYPSAIPWGTLAEMISQGKTCDEMSEMLSDCLKQQIDGSLRCYKYGDKIYILPELNDRPIKIVMENDWKYTVDGNKLIISEDLDAEDYEVTDTLIRIKINGIWHELERC